MKVHSTEGIIKLMVCNEGVDVTGSGIPFDLSVQFSNLVNSNALFEIDSKNESKGKSSWQEDERLGWMIRMDMRKKIRASERVTFPFHITPSFLDDGRMSFAWARLKKFKKQVWMRTWTRIRIWIVRTPENHSDNSERWSDEIQIKARNWNSSFKYFSNDTIHAPLTS